MAISQVTFNDLGHVDFVPQAVLRSPVDYFARRLGYKFESDCDDFDEYESAFFKLDNDTPFGLIHYRGNPPETTTIYVNRSLPADAARRLIRRIIHDFDLPDAAAESVRD